jgi:hypothetical protein
VLGEERHDALRDFWTALPQEIGVFYASSRHEASAKPQRQRAKGIVPHRERREDPGERPEPDGDTGSRACRVGPVAFATPESEGAEYVGESGME